MEKTKKNECANSGASEVKRMTEQGGELAQGGGEAAREGEMPGCRDGEMPKAGAVLGLAQGDDGEMPECRDAEMPKAGAECEAGAWTREAEAEACHKRVRALAHIMFDAVGDAEPNADANEVYMALLQMVYAMVVIKAQTKAREMMLEQLDTTVRQLKDRLNQKK